MSTIRNIKHCFNTSEMYNVFSACTYMPTWEKFTSRAVEYMNNDAIHIFGYYEDSRLAGIIAVNQNQDGSFEIKGIAVNPECRNRGIGRKLVQYVCDELPVSKLHAETDDDAIEFYRSCGFETEVFSRMFESGEFRRYKCLLHI